MNTMDETPYRIFLLNGTAFNINQEDGQNIVRDLDDSSVIAFEVVMRETSSGRVIRKFPRESLEGIEYPETNE